MTYYLEKSDWLDMLHIPEGMRLNMLNSPDRLDALLKPSLAKYAKDKVIIDLGCGTGALGIYALEQGAKFVYFVERDIQMFHILSNVLSQKLDSTKYKLINLDIEELKISDFEYETPEIVVSEFYGPRLFDEGYVNYTKHLRSLFPTCYFIPEIYRMEFYLVDIDYQSQPIWPTDISFVDHFKFMYREKGFSRHIDINDMAHKVGTIEFNANTQHFQNDLIFKYELTAEKLLLGKAHGLHDDIDTAYTALGWLLTKEDTGKTFNIYFDAQNYFNPVKREI